MFQRWRVTVGAGLVICVSLAGGALWALRGRAEPAPSALAMVGDRRPVSETHALLALLRSAGADGLDLGRYPVAEIERELAASPEDARIHDGETLLRDTVLAYAKDLRVPAATGLIYGDPELSPVAPDIFSFADPAGTLRRLQNRNLVYAGLRNGLAWYRQRWSRLSQVQIPAGEPLVFGSSGARVALLRRRLGLSASDRFDTDLGRALKEFQATHGLAAAPEAGTATIDALNAGAAHFEKIIIANMDRARGLPIDGRRYVLVDTAGATIRMIEGGREVGTMRAVVGKPGMATPELAGLIRFAVVNPYWNIPPDLVRASVAPKVLERGPGYLAERRFALFANWQPAAPTLAAEKVDWAAVAAGIKQVWVRQLPGGENMMGRVKFMFPNRLGIYLHDTPRKSDFARSDRRLSSGCVRVEDAQRLAGWIFNDPAVLAENGGTDERIDIAKPVPVYILYFTALPMDGKVRFQRDVDDRDRALLQRLAKQESTSVRS